MEHKTMEQQQLRRVVTSTVVVCAGCHRESKVYEEMWRDDLGDHYHNRCAPRQKPTVKTVSIHDSLAVKSHGK